jgi:hypothetical protein
MKKTFFLIVAIELIMIASLVFYIYEKAVRDNLSTNPIEKSAILYSPTQELKHFYEPKAGSVDPDLNDSPIKAKYTINDDTLNERYDYPRLKSDKTYRIITLGDSFTYGLYVDTEDNWTEVLEDKLNGLKCPNIVKFEVINLGVHGYDTRYAVERYNKRGVKYQADLVIWLFVDMLRIDEKLIPFSNQYEKKLGNTDDYYLPWRQARLDIMDSLGVSGVIAYQKKSLQLFEDLYKGQLLVVPSWRIAKNSPEEKLLKEFSATGKSFHYLNSIQTLSDKSLLFDTDPHPNTKGHDYIASQLLKYLSGSDIFSCDKNVD